MCVCAECGGGFRVISEPDLSSREVNTWSAGVFQLKEFSIFTFLISDHFICH